MDARNDIHYPLAPFFSAIDSTGSLLANPDAWPAAASVTRDHFFADCNPTLMDAVEARFDLDLEFFQSTLMLFDTSLLEDSTVAEIARLYAEYSPIASSDQIIFSLYWHQVRHAYRHLPYRLPESLMIPYDFLPRVPDARYIVTAWRSDASKP